LKIFNDFSRENHGHGCHEHGVRWGIFGGKLSFKKMPAGGRLCTLQENPHFLVPTVKVRQPDGTPIAGTLLISFAELSILPLLFMFVALYFFSLSWVITWFSHCLDDYATIVRIFDAFIASGYVVHPPPAARPKPKFFFRPSSPTLLPIDDATSIAVFYPLCVSAQLVLVSSRTVSDLGIATIDHRCDDEKKKKLLSWGDILVSLRS
jgi:hypothetical protein